MPIKDIIARQTKYQDSILYGFETELRAIVQRAQARVIARLQGGLSITRGVIDGTGANMRLLRRAGDLFMKELQRAGFDALSESFADSFSGTLPYLQDVIKDLGEQVGKKWTSLGLTAADLDLLVAVQANTVAALHAAVQTAANTALTRGLLGVTGLKFGTLVETLSSKFEASIGQATTIGNTAVNMFLATASERAFNVIAEGLPPNALRYRYSGPADKLEREFCRHLTDADKSYTRAQIDKMDNGQLPNVMISRGGINCRHHWVLDTRAVEASLASVA